MALVLGCVALLAVLAVVGVVAVAKLNARRAVTAADESRRSAEASRPVGPASPGPTSTTPSPTARPTPTASRSSSASSRSSASSTSSPSEKKPVYTYTGRGAETSRLYNAVFSAGSLGCSGIELRKPPVPDKAMKGYVQQIVRCLVSQFDGPVKEQGFTLTTPTVTVFSQDVRSPCGVVGVRQYPAYYCSVDRTIYMNLKTDDTNYGYYGTDMGYWQIVAHEFGHHLQAVGGVFSDYTTWYQAADRAERQELSRRLELQATCLGAVQLNAMWKSLELDTADYAQMDFFNTSFSDTGRDHGSGASNKRWYDRGYSGAWSSFGDCNTWRAKAGDVS